jgi:hypothetical protein
MHIKNEEKRIKKEKFKDSKCYLCTKINPDDQRQTETLYIEVNKSR